MIFVDTNVFMYAVGRAHPLKDEARAFLTFAVPDPGVRLCTSAEALQELLHAYWDDLKGRFNPLFKKPGRGETLHIWGMLPAV